MQVLVNNAPLKFYRPITMTPQANASFLLDSFPNIWFMRIELPVRKSTLMCVRALYETVHGPCGTATAAVLKRGGATGAFNSSRELEASMQG